MLPTYMHTNAHTHMYAYTSMAGMESVGKDMLKHANFQYADKTDTHTHTGTLAQCVCASEIAYATCMPAQEKCSTEMHLG